MQQSHPLVSPPFLLSKFHNDMKFLRSLHAHHQVYRLQFTDITQLPPPDNSLPRGLPVLRQGCPLISIQAVVNLARDIL